MLYYSNARVTYAGHGSIKGASMLDKVASMLESIASMLDSIASMPDKGPLMPDMGTWHSTGASTGGFMLMNQGGHEAYG